MKNTFINTFLIWYVLVYFIPPITIFYGSERVLSGYNLENSIYLTFIYLIIVLVFLISLRKLLNFRFKQITIRSSNSSLIKSAVILFCLIYLFLCIDFFINYGIGFRQRGNLSEAPSVLVLRYFKVLTPIILFIVIQNCIRNTKIDIFSRCIFISLFFSYSFALDGSADFAFLLICFGLSCLSSMQFNAFFVKKLTFPRIFFIVLAGSVGMIGILFAGLANKTLELALTLFESDSTYEILLNMIDSILSRSFTAFASVHNLLETNLFSLNLSYDYFNSTFDLIVHRFEKIFSFGFPTIPEDFIGGINRLNFLNIYTTYLPRSGTSPQLVASFMFVSFPPISFILMFGYLLFISMCFNSLNSENGNFLTILFSLFFIYRFFESPLDFYNVFEPFTLSLIALFLCSIFKLEEKTNV